MKNRQKSKLLYLLITLFIFTSTLLTPIPANAIDISTEKMDLVIVFDDNNIDKSVEDIVTNSWGEIINEFPDLGGIEVKCSADLIPIIKSIDTVQSLAPNTVIKLSNEKVAEFLESEDESNNIADNLYEK